MILTNRPETWTCALEGDLYVVRDTKGAKVCSGTTQRACVMAGLLAAKLVRRAVRIVDGGKRGGK